ncbi:hypothetical protein HWV62_19119 [Athelia sp. TMB]|nr:hypothetical protein HWV62_19119 [Athelia sp. TMB]
MSPTMIYGTAWSVTLFQLRLGFTIMNLKEKNKRLPDLWYRPSWRALERLIQLKHYREDLVGEALLELSSKHSIKREDLFLQTKYDEHH